MNESEIKRVESALGYAIPHHFRSFILQNDKEIREAEATLPLRVVVYTDPEEMIDDNRLPQEYPDAFCIGEENLPWPENHLIVASNGAGDYWYVHRDASDLGIWIYRKWQEIECANRTLDEWLEELRAAVRAPEPWQ